jgi:hypothetical protein
MEEEGVGQKENAEDKEKIDRKNKNVIKSCRTQGHTGIRCQISCKDL